MVMGKVIRARAWQHKGTGSRASIYGAHPAGGMPGNMKADWEVVETGWTIAWPDGTVGCMKPPFATQEGAEAYLAAHSNFPGMSQYAN